MTIDRIRQFLKTQADSGGLYNANSDRRFLPEVQKEHGQEGAVILIHRLNQHQFIGFEPDTRSECGLVAGKQY